MGKDNQQDMNIVHNIGAITTGKRQNKEYELDNYEKQDQKRQKIDSAKITLETDVKSVNPDMVVDSSDSVMKKIKKDYKINNEISENDFQLFINSLKNSHVEAQKFIKEYLTTHSDLTYNDLATLLLIKAARGDDIFLPDMILSVFFTNKIANIHCLTALDSHNKTIVAHVLETKSCIPILANQIFNSVNAVKPHFNKLTLSDNLLDTIANALTDYHFRLHPNVLIDDLLRPLYTEESIEQLIDVVGKDWFLYYCVEED